MNKFIGIGRTTKDIEIKKTQNGKEYTIFQLAV
ncbi:single-stranded DNA-binding protein [Spiroplasma poulsonii]|nr:single-stranded DNA-binding protein [Spiroplasma poulsonii]PQM29898.1 Single-stranded DNA-binding protein [Spiroplasma poulsonii]